MALKVIRFITLIKCWTKQGLLFALPYWCTEIHYRFYPYTSSWSSAVEISMIMSLLRYVENFQCVLWFTHAVKLLHIYYI